MAITACDDVFSRSKLGFDNSAIVIASECVRTVATRKTTKDATKKSNETSRCEYTFINPEAHEIGKQNKV